MASSSSVKHDIILNTFRFRTQLSYFSNFTFLSFLYYLVMLGF